MDQGLHKSEKLKSRKLIEQLFSRGKTLKKYPILLVYLEAETTQIKPFQVAVSVSKRKFKKAVDRNRIKRQMRESYRKHKSAFLEIKKNDKKYFAMFIFVGNEHLDSSLIESKINTLLHRLSDTL
ncbi:MAG: ribonuclease P protein component [Flavobacteriales bacterium]|jgi:ribonuclease P protein component